MLLSAASQSSACLPARGVAPTGHVRGGLFPEAYVHGLLRARAIMLDVGGLNALAALVELLKVAPFI